MRSYPPAVLFAVGILFILVVLLHYSTVISRLSDQNTILAQRLALLEHGAQGTASPRVGGSAASSVPPLDRLGDEVERPLLRLLEDARDVLADDADPEHLHPAEQEHDGEQRRPALPARAVKNRM